MTETSLHCPHCQKEFTWDEIRKEGERADIEGMLNFLKRQTGESFEAWNITEAYFVKCSCGQGFVLAEVPDACTPDERGYSAPAYLTLALHGKPEKTERVLPLRIEKQSDSEISLRRDALKRVK